METLLSFILSGMLFLGILCSVKGLMAMRRNDRESRLYRAAPQLFTLGCLFISTSLPILLYMISVPFFIGIAILAILSISSIVWGVYKVHTALTNSPKLEPIAPWMIFCGIMMLILSEPLWPYHIPQPFVSFYVLAASLFFLIIPYLQMKLRKRGTRKQ